MINVKDKVKDTITGFEGIVIARTEWLNGCVRCCIQSQKLKDGKILDTETIDEGQLEIIEAGNRETVDKPPGSNRPSVEMGMETPER